MIVVAYTLIVLGLSITPSFGEIHSHFQSSALYYHNTNEVSDIMPVSTTSKYSAPTLNPTTHRPKPIHTIALESSSAPSIVPFSNIYETLSIVSTENPTTFPTKKPTRSPTSKPTRKPIKSPTFFPTYSPTRRPTRRPTKAPTFRPSKPPSTAPSPQPSLAPTLGAVSHNSKTLFKDGFVSRGWIATFVVLGFIIFFIMIGSIHTFMNREVEPTYMQGVVSAAHIPLSRTSPRPKK